MVWWCGGVVVWWCGGVVVWWCDGVVVWWCGGVVVWWCGGVVVWWCGVAVWWCAVMVCCGGGYSYHLSFCGGFPQVTEKFDQKLLEFMFVETLSYCYIKNYSLHSPSLSPIRSPAALLSSQRKQ